MNDFEILSKPSSKEVGEYGEQCFVLQCLRRGIIPCNPVGDSQPYDFITEANGVLNRVQIKTRVSAGGRDSSRGVFSVQTSNGGQRETKYSNLTIDFLVVLLAEFDVFYVIPVDNITTKSISINHFSPDQNRFLEFQERWDLLK